MRRGAAVPHRVGNALEHLTQALTPGAVDHLEVGVLVVDADDLVALERALEATRETCFFQVGESKYGKPILDRVLTPTTPLDEAAKCALVSMDSTLKSNLSVGLPLDLLVYREGTFQSDQIVCIDEQNPYFQMIHSTWGQRLREVFEGIADPVWDGRATAQPLLSALSRYEPLRKISRPEERVV